MSQSLRMLLLTKPFCRTEGRTSFIMPGQALHVNSETSPLQGVGTAQQSEALTRFRRVARSRPVLTNRFGAATFDGSQSRETRMKRLKNIPVKIDPERLRKALRLDSSDKVQPLLEAAQPLIKARAAYTVCYVEARFDDAVQIDGYRLTSGVLRKNLEKAERVFPYVVTIGQELEDLATSYEDLLRQYYFDVLGNLAVTAAREYLEKHLRQGFGLGKMSRMSPGSLKDWPIEEQKVLFAILGDVEASIGVTLKETFLMIPRKSVSGIAFPTEIPFLSCQLCPRENCSARQADYDRELVAKYRIEE